VEFRLSVSPDGKLVLTGGHDPDFNGQVEIWDATLERRLTILKGHRDFISAVAFSPNGRWIVSAGHGPGALNGNPDNAVRIWERREPRAADR
jgi:WD40 repeat protein